MSDQYLRKSSLIVAEDDQGLDLSELHFTFDIKQSDLQTPNNALIRVFNLSDKTAQQVQSQYTRVVLQAGYQQGNFGIIFDGTLKQVKRGRLNATDTYLDLYAADGDKAYNFSVVNSTMAAGATQQQKLETITKAMGPQGVTLGYNPAASTGGVLPRGKVLFGMARDYMKDYCDTTNTSWSIQDGKVVVIEQTGYLPDQAIVLTSKTGMIGMPEQTDNGIRVRSLLNPLTKVGGRVHINNASIQRALINIQYTAINLLASISDDGFYKLYVVEHKGDNRGNDWYTDMTCLSVDSSAAPDDSVKPYGG